MNAPQVQRYESTGYRSASLARICDITNALGVRVTERMSLPGTDTARDTRVGR